MFMDSSSAHLFEVTRPTHETLQCVGTQQTEEDWLGVAVELGMGVVGPGYDYCTDEELVSLVKYLIHLS